MKFIILLFAIVSCLKLSSGNISIQNNSEVFLESLNQKTSIETSTSQHNLQSENIKSTEQIEALIDNECEVYKAQISPYVTVDNEIDANDLESSHDYFKKLAVLRFEVSIKTVTNIKINNFTVKLERKIDLIYNTEMEKVHQKGFGRGSFRKFNDGAKNFKLPKLCKTFRIALIADLDEKSRKDVKSDVYRSIFKSGNLDFDSSKKLFSFRWDVDVTEITSGYSYGGKN